MIKVFLFLFGILLCSISLTFCILYLNLLIIGYSFFDYVKFISRSFVSICFIIGSISIYISIKRWGIKK